MKLSPPPATLDAVALTRRRPEDKSEVWHPRKSVRLYLDDVDDVLAVLQQTDPKVGVLTPDFAGHMYRADELKVTGQRTLDDLVLTAGSQDHGISVELKRPVSVRIEPSDALDLTGARQKIQEVLSRSQERFGGWDVNTASNEVVGAAISGLVLLGLLVTSQGETRTSGWLWREALVALIPLALAAVAFGRKLTGPNKRPRATVVLAYRAEAPTWWERHHTAVTISLVTNVLVAAVFFLLGRLLA